MKILHTLLLCSAGTSGLLLPAMPVMAQDSDPTAEEGTFDGETIIVQARRRDEDVQDVPAVIDAVTAEEVTKLNLRDSKEVSTLVPGLQLSTESNGVGGSAKLRGVNFDVNASGFNSTVEFYMNDASITAGPIIQQMFDIGQIEVQRGPQGTLRGRAAPSGSITVTTRKPDLDGFGGTVDATANTIGTTNLKAALNVPIIEGIAAIRVAGVLDQSDGDRVRSIYTRRDPHSKTKAGRISALVEPADWLRLEGVYQHMERNAIAYDQSASFSEVNSSAPTSNPVISSKDRRSIQPYYRTVDQKYDIFNWRAETKLAGQALIYQGQHYTQKILSTTPQDEAVVFPNNKIEQPTDSRLKSTSHEIRLQNEERVAGLFDYVVGYYHADNNPPTDLIRRTPIRLPALFGGGLAQVVDTPISRKGESKERSYFGNVTLHLSEATEISGGARHIDYETDNILVVNGQTLTNSTLKGKKWIYSGSVKHNFSDDLMVYASTGSS